MRFKRRKIQREVRWDQHEGKNGEEFEEINTKENNGDKFGKMKKNEKTSASSVKSERRKKAATRLVGSIRC